MEDGDLYGILRLRSGQMGQDMQHRERDVAEEHQGDATGQRFGDAPAALAHAAVRTKAAQDVDLMDRPIASVDFDPVRKVPPQPCPSRFGALGRPGFRASYP